nr:MAG TPA: hypothetical protein [Caudoviricetes sp.]
MNKLIITQSTVFTFGNILLSSKYKTNRTFHIRPYIFNKEYYILKI